jgi:hypothetical protein
MTCSWKWGATTSEPGRGQVGKRASQVDALDEFFRAVIEYVYIAPVKRHRLRETLKGFQADRQADQT